MEITFTDYWATLSAENKRQLANRLHTSNAYLSQLAHGHRKPSRRMAEMACIVTGLRLEFPTCCED
jgi:transcriptional regulator with XRE-family HTH domain